MTDNEREMVEALLKTSQIQFDLVKKLLKEDEHRQTYPSRPARVWKDGVRVPEPGITILESA